MPASQAPVQQPNQSLDPLFKYDPLSPVFSPVDKLGQKLNDQMGLNVTAAYTFLYQSATNVAPGTNNDLVNGRLDLGARLDFLQGGQRHRIAWIFTAVGANIGEDQRFNLNSNVGSSEGIDSLQGGGRQEFGYGESTYWRQSFFNNKLAIYVGKLHPNQHMDLSPSLPTKQAISRRYI